MQLKIWEILSYCLLKRLYNYPSTTRHEDVGSSHTGKVFAKRSKLSMEEKSCKGYKGWFCGLSLAGAEPYPQGLCPSPQELGFPPQSLYGYLWNIHCVPCTLLGPGGMTRSQTLDLPPRNLWSNWAAKKSLLRREATVQKTESPASKWGLWTINVSGGWGGVGSLLALGSLLRGSKIYANLEEWVRFC